MPLTFRDRDGRKLTRFTVEHHLSIHSLLNVVSWAIANNHAEFGNLRRLQNTDAFKQAVEAVLWGATYHEFDPVAPPPEPVSEALVLVAQHVGREQALELLRGPRITPLEEAALNDPVIRDAIGEAKSGDRSVLVQRERPAQIEVDEAMLDEGPHGKP